MPLGLTKRDAALTAVLDILADGELALFDGVPVPVNGSVTAPGVEVGSDGGYEPQPLNNSMWTVDDGASVTVEFGPASGEWDAVPRFWLWRTGAGVVQAWGALRNPVLVSAAASSVPVTCEMTWADPTASDE